MFTKKIKGNTYLEIIVQIMIIISIITGVLAVFDSYKDFMKKVELHENLLTLANKKSYNFEKKEIKGTINSLEFINKELKFEDFKIIDEKIKLDIVIKAKKNKELDSFYLIYTPSEVPFYRSNPKSSLINLISDLNDNLNKKKENKYKINHYYAANKNDILKEISIEECKKTSECVLIIATKNT